MSRQNWLIGLMFFSPWASGAGSIRRLTTYNDFNANLVNLMRCARDKPLALIREIGFLTLNARDDFEMYKKFVEKEFA